MVNMRKAKTFSTLEEERNSAVSSKKFVFIIRDFSSLILAMNIFYNVYRKLQGVNGLNHAKVFQYLQVWWKAKIYFGLKIRKYFIYNLTSNVF